MTNESRFSRNNTVVVAASSLMILAAAVIVLLPLRPSAPDAEALTVEREIKAILEADPRDGGSLAALRDRFPSGYLIGEPAGVYWPLLSREQHARLSQEIEDLDLSEGRIRAHPAGIMLLLNPPGDRRPHLFDHRVQGEG